MSSLGRMAARADEPPPGISIVIPAYRSAGSLPALHDRLVTVLAGLGYDFEILIVNDGSPDTTWEVITALATADPHVLGIDLRRNYGQHSALLCGLRAARFATTVTIDDDLQHPPEEIPRLLDELSEGFDVVYGRPRDEAHGFLRDIASQLTKFALQSVMAAETARSVSAFRVLRTSLRESFRSYEGTFVSLDVLLTWGTNRFSAISVREDARTVGNSNYTFGMLAIHALNLITGFTTRPLQLASLVGFAFTGLGMLALVYVVGRYLLYGGSVPGFSFLASLIAIFSGAQLFSLGIFGEYLARIHVRSLGRPPYLVRETTDRTLL